MSIDRSPLSSRATVTAGSLACLLASWALLSLVMLVFTHDLRGPWLPAPGEVLPRVGTASRLWHDLLARGPTAFLPTLVVLGTSVGLFLRQARHASRLARLALRFAAISAGAAVVGWLATPIVFELDLRLLATSRIDLTYSFSEHAISIYFWVLLLLVWFWLQLVPAEQRVRDQPALKTADHEFRAIPEKPGRVGPAYVLGALLGAVAFVPVGLYLQWALPIDGPGELFVSLLSVPLLLVALALLSRPVVVPSWPRRSRRTSLAIGILVFFALIQATIFFPSITRRIGPWHELRARLVQKSQEIDDARARFGVAESVKLTPEQIAQIEAAVFPTPEEFVFPIINRRVILKLMTYRRPYVGVRYGTGSRGVIFDLDTMLAIYAD